MSHEVVRRVEEVAGQFAGAADDTERGGKLSDESVKLVRQAGVMRMLQPADFGGYAAHPRDFATAATCAWFGLP
jgi:alkylation response protein AidB-like acyl-CoA dehydrogenase